MPDKETAAPIGNSHIVFRYAQRPEYLRRVYEQWERGNAESERHPLAVGGTADIKTPHEAWVNLVGDLAPGEWLDLGGPETLNRMIRYLDPSELQTVHGPYRVADEGERNRLAILLWRHLVVHREARRSR